MHVERVGAGPAVVLVHGSVRDGRAAWAEQRPLAERWTLVIPDRPGFGDGPLVGRVDFEVDSPLIAELFRGGVHLVGRASGDLGDEQGRAGARGGGDKHGAQLNAVSRSA